MFKKLTYRLLKAEGWHEVIWSTLVVTLFLFTINFVPYESIWALLLAVGKNALQGLSIGLFLFAIINVVEIRFEIYFSKQQRYALTINTDAQLNNISHSRLIHSYFREMIIEIIENCQNIQEEKPILVNPYTVYGHIIHSSKYFCKNIILPLHQTVGNIFMTKESSDTFFLML